MRNLCFNKDFFRMALVLTWCSGCALPVNISPVSFEEVEAVDFIEDYSCDLDGWRSKFGLNVKFFSNIDTCIRLDDVTVMSGGKRRKFKIYDQKNGTYPDSLFHVANGYNWMLINSKMPKDDFDTLSVSVQFPKQNSIWEILRFVPANGIHGYQMRGMSSFERDIGDAHGGYCL